MKTNSINSINKIALSLFGVVVSKSSIATPQERKISTEESLFTDFNVAVAPYARYAIDEINQFVKAKRKKASELNATFYRSWNDVVSKSRFELLIDQIFHYSSTYGTNFEGEVYVPADKVGLILDKEDAKLPLFVIYAMEEKALTEKVVNLLSSGVALKQETVEGALELLNLLGELVKNSHKINNKEAKIIAFEKYDLKNVFNQSDLIRYLVFKVTQSSLLIKNNETLNAIKDSRFDVSKILLSYGISLLAESFNRYKAFYLAFKKAHKANVPVINKIAKLSKVLHKPMVENPLNKVSVKVFDFKTIEALASYPMPTLIRAYNAALLSSIYSEYSSFVIRNGKSWINNEKNNLNEAKIQVSRINAKILEEVIIKRIGENFKDKQFFIPEGIEYGLPLSEKQMCGNIPHNTIISTKDTMTVGAFWDEGYRVTDIDVSATESNGETYGWSRSYYDERDDAHIIYSGDMTSPGPNGAVEYLTFRNNNKKKKEPRVFSIHVNSFSYNYNTEEDLKERVEKGYKFDILVGVTKDDNLSLQAMMKPKDLLFSGERIAHKDGNTLGIVVVDGKDKKFIFAPSESSNSRVNIRNPDLENASNKALIHRMNNSLTLNKLIKLLGGEVVYERNQEAVDLSPQKINKDFFNLIVG